MEGQKICTNPLEMWRTHSDRGVPSSANWKPTKALMRRQQYVQATKPVYTAANHCGADLAIESKPHNDEDILDIRRWQSE